MNIHKQQKVRKQSVSRGRAASTKIGTNYIRPENYTDAYLRSSYSPNPMHNKHKYSTHSNIPKDSSNQYAEQNKNRTLLTQITPVKKTQVSNVRNNIDKHSEHKAQALKARAKQQKRISSSVSYYSEQQRPTKVKNKKSIGGMANMILKKKKKVMNNTVHKPGGQGPLMNTSANATTMIQSENQVQVNDQNDNQKFWQWNLLANLSSQRGNRTSKLDNNTADNGRNTSTTQNNSMATKKASFHLNRKGEYDRKAKKSGNFTSLGIHTATKKFQLTGVERNSKYKFQQQMNKSMGGPEQDCERQEQKKRKLMICKDTTKNSANRQYKPGRKVKKMSNLVSIQVQQKDSEQMQVSNKTQKAMGLHQQNQSMLNPQLSHNDQKKAMTSLNLSLMFNNNYSSLSSGERPSNTQTTTSSTKKAQNAQMKKHPRSKSNYAYNTNQAVTNVDLTKANNTQQMIDILKQLDETNIDQVQTTQQIPRTNSKAHERVKYIGNHRNQNFDKLHTNSKLASIPDENWQSQQFSQNSSASWNLQMKKRNLHAINNDRASAPLQPEEAMNSLRNFREPQNQIQIIEKNLITNLEEHENTSRQDMNRAQQADNLLCILSKASDQLIDCQPELGPVLSLIKNEYEEHIQRSDKVQLEKEKLSAQKAKMQLAKVMDENRSKEKQIKSLEQDMESLKNKLKEMKEQNEKLYTQNKEVNFQMKDLTEKCLAMEEMQNLDSTDSELAFKLKEARDWEHTQQIEEMDTKKAFGSNEPSIPKLDLSAILEWREQQNLIEQEDGEEEEEGEMESEEEECDINEEDVHSDQRQFFFDGSGLVSTDSLERKNQLEIRKEKIKQMLNQENNQEESQESESQQSDSQWSSCHVVDEGEQQTVGEIHDSDYLVRLKYLLNESKQGQVAGLSNMQSKSEKVINVHPQEERDYSIEESESEYTSHGTQDSIDYGLEPDSHTSSIAFDYTEHVNSKPVDLNPPVPKLDLQKALYPNIQNISNIQNIQPTQENKPNSKPQNEQNVPKVKQYTLEDGPKIPPLNLLGMGGNQKTLPLDNELQAEYETVQFNEDSGDVPDSINQQDNPVPFAFNSQPGGMGLGLDLSKLKKKEEDALDGVDFQDEFMAMADEFSESWREQLMREKRF